MSEVRRAATGNVIFICTIWEFGLSIDYMLVIRPIKLDDLDQLLELATMTGFGLTTLPRDAELLRERILESDNSFDRITKRPRGETYLFVLEDLKNGKVRRNLRHRLQGGGI